MTPYQPPTYEPDAEFGDFEALPPGRYVAVVEAVEVKFGADSGEAYLAWTFTIAEGEYEGRKAWNNTTLIEGKSFGFWATMKAAIGDGDTADFAKQSDFADEYEYAEEVATLTCGRMVELAIGNRMYNGQKRTDVQAVKPWDGQQLDTAPLNREEKTKRGTAERGKAKTPARAPASPAGAKRGRTGDMDF